MDTVLTIAIGVLGIGVMILVHELGHYLAARAAGVHVEIFSIGWGRRLVGVRRGGTWYQISVFPFGGYCKMRGDEVLRGAGREEWTPSTTERSLEKGAFFAVGPWRRIAIIVAGPLANVAFAVIVLTIVFWAGYTIRSPGNRIVVAADQSSPAASAGLATGDRIVAVEGRRVLSFQDIIREVSPAPDRELRITVERDGRALVAAVTPERDPDTQTGRIGVYAWIDPVVGMVEESTVQDDTGGSDRGSSPPRLAPGDRIVAVDGIAVAHTIDLYEALRRRGSPVELTVERDGRLIAIRQEVIEDAGGVALAGARLRISLMHYREPGPARALGAALEEIGRTVRLTVEGLARLLRGGGVQDAVAGPLRLTYYVGAVARSGLQIGVAAGVTDFLRFLSVISVVLFLMNLLPIPALDGGHIVLYGVELIIGRRVKPAVVYRIQTIGVSLLILIAISVTLSDILFLAGRR